MHWQIDTPNIEIDDDAIDFFWMQQEHRRTNFEPMLIKLSDVIFAKLKKFRYRRAKIKRGPGRGRYRHVLIGPAHLNLFDKDVFANASTGYRIDHD